MRVTVELSLYPLTDGYLPKIEAFIAALRSELERRDGIEMSVNQMSTQIAGDLGVVMAVLESVLGRSFGDGKPEVLVAKFLNADLPIHVAPPV